MMSDVKPKKEILHTNIWHEQAESDNPFVAAKCFCSGYDVYGDILTGASWFEYLYLLFKLERPRNWQASMLEKVAIAVANPGVRSHPVRAAMNAGAGGSTSASALMASLAVGAGSLGGAREILLCVSRWQVCKQDVNAWVDSFVCNQNTEVDSWPETEHPSGFDPNGVSCSIPVLQLLNLCADYDDAKNTQWLKKNRNMLEGKFEMPLAMTGVVSTVLHDIGFSAEQSEMLYLFLMLPGAAVHALEQKKLGYKKYPFFLDKMSIDYKE
jgi:citrate synthase